MHVRSLRALACAFAASTAACSLAPRHSATTDAPALCRKEDGLVISARRWLSLPDGPADTIGKHPGFLPDVPALPARQIVTVRDEAICRAVAGALARSRGDSVPVAVSVLRFGTSRHVAWDLVEKPGARPAIFLTYYVLDQAMHVLHVVST